MMGLRNCCKDCTDRHKGCHGTCERYAAAKAELEEAKAKQSVEIGYTAYVAEAVRRVKKTRKRKKA